MEKDISKDNKNDEEKKNEILNEIRNDIYKSLDSNALDIRPSDACHLLGFIAGEISQYTTRENNEETTNSTLNAFTNQLSASFIQGYQVAEKDHEEESTDEDV